MTQSEVEEIIAEQATEVEAMTEAVMASSDPDPSSARDHVTAPPTTIDRVHVTETCEMSYIDAVRAALRAELSADPRTIVYGEDVGKPGGIFGGSRNLQREFGADRVFDTPIAENAILGSAVGAAISGMKPIVEIMWTDFLMVALDQLVNQASNVRYLTSGRSTVPMTVRMQQGATPGSCAQHSQSLEALLAHIPGLKVALASSPHDAYSLIRAAAADPDPCIVIEARSLFPNMGPVQLTQGAEPVGKARLRREGTDVGIVTWSTMVPRALAAAEELATAGIEVAVLDLRWLNPLDKAALAKLAKQVGGRILILHEAVKTGGFAGEVAFQLNEMDLGFPLTIRRLATADIRMPASAVLQAVLIPGLDAIAIAVRDILSVRTSPT
jgi:2-oxoisovalerate dehydrogenase E1 component